LDEVKTVEKVVESAAKVFATNPGAVEPMRPEISEVKEVTKPVKK
jgi:hypothetical protein